MKKYLYFDGHGLVRAILWGSALLVLVGCGGSTSFHPVPSPAPNPPAVVSQQ